MHELTLSAGMSCERLRRALREDRSAWKFAVFIGNVAEHADTKTLTREHALLQHFLEGHLESHFVQEERELFPVLAQRGHAREIEEAMRQHGEIRRLRERFAKVSSDDPNTMRAFLSDVARELKGHVRYEAAFVYDDLKHAEVDEYREDIDALLADVAGG